MSYDHSTALRALLGSTSDLMYFLDADGRYQYVGEHAAKVMRQTPEAMIGRTPREVGVSEEVAARFDARRVEVMTNGNALRHETTWSGPDGTIILDSVIAPVLDDGRVIGVVVVARDVTERRRIEAHTRFVSDLNQTLLPLTDADEIMALTARLLGQHLGVDRCAYAEVEEDEDHFTITGDYTRDTFSLVGRYTLSSFGPAHQAALAGQPYVVEDAETDPRMEPFREAYRQTGIAAVIQVTLKKRGRFVAGMAVHQKVPRRWTPDEIDVVQTVVNRCWESLERARATRLLAESEERYRSLISILSSIVWTVDAEGRMVAEQKSWQAYTGQTEEEYRDFGWAAAVHQGDIERLLATWQQAVATRSVYRSGGRLWHAATQEYRWFEVAAAPLTDANGNVREWIGTVSDVHERRKAEEHVAEQRRWLQAVLDSLPVAVLLIDPETNEVRFANHAATEANVAIDAAAARLARGERIDDLQLTAGERTYLLSGDRLPPLYGEPATGILAFQNITPLKEIEDELRRASRLKDEFLATLSHELRTPLTAIIGWATLLATEELDRDTLRSALQTIEQNAKAQARLIEDLVDVSRIVAGKLQVELKPIAVAPVVRAAVESVRPAVDAKGIALALQLDERAIVMGDASRLQQVIWNLLSNAVRFTPPQGRIDVGLARRDELLQLTVTDNGEGIDPEFLPHVFDRFRQGDMSSTRPHGGLGLGLAIVRHLVELHGGSVGAESRGFGSGATFRVCLPLPGRAGDDAPAPRAQQTRAELHGLSVLVVDDAADAREMIRIMLQRAGASVTTAASAAEAVEAMARVRPDVLLSDIGMPDEDGNRMLRRLRESGDRTPAIALTAYAGREAAEASLSAGYVRHMAKPIDARELVVAVAEVARGGRR